MKMGRGKKRKKEKRACSNAEKGLDDLFWGAFFTSTTTDSLPVGWTLGRITQEVAATGWWKILQTHLFCLDGSHIFKNICLAKAHIS